MWWLAALASGHLFLFVTIVAAMYNPAGRYLCSLSSCVIELGMAIQVVKTFGVASWRRTWLA